MILGAGKITFFSVSFRWNWKFVVKKSTIKILFFGKILFQFFWLHFFYHRKFPMVNHLSHKILVFDHSTPFSLFLWNSITLFTSFMILFSLFFVWKREYLAFFVKKVGFTGKKSSMEKTLKPTFFKKKDQNLVFSHKKEWK